MSLRARLLLPAFLLSGVAALAYEMAWVRQLVMLFGVTYFAITTILSVFMAGLALGAVVAGRLVDRMRVPPLLAFAGLEIFLGAYAQAFPWLLRGVDRLYLGLATGTDLSFTTHALLRFLFAALVLLPPTLASGATLPAATKAFVTGDARIGRELALLYGANVVGAALGCFGTTFFVIGLWGYPTATWVGTLANLVAALLAVAAWRADRSRLEVAPASPSPWLPGSFAVGAAWFATGFAGVGGEVLWTRVFSQAGFNPATYVFGLVLVTYLAGHAAGSALLYPLLARRIHPHRMFVSLIAAIALLVAGSVLALTLRHDELQAIGWLRALGIVLPWERAWILVPAVLLPGACTGALFPLASRLSIRDTVGIGTGVGSLSALSTVGGIVGSFLTGFWLMPALGAIPCLLAMASFAGLAAAWSRRAFGGAGLRETLALSLGIVALAVGLVLVVPPSSHLILFPGEKLVAFDEGRNSSTAVVDHPSGQRFMLVSGERLQGGGSDVNLAVALHPRARRAAVIGVGTGSVTAAALSRGELESVTAIDIDGEIPRFIPYMLGEKAALFAPPRFTFLENDGRHFLRTWPGTFDLIVNDAAIYAWYLELSTLEFDRLVRSRLAPEGLYVGRLHMWRITEQAFKSEVRTFLEVFPNAAFWKLTEDIGMLVGRNGSLPVDRTDRPLPQGGYAPSLWHDAAQLQEQAAGGRLVTDDHPLHVPDTFLPRDLYPIIEYTSPDRLPQPPPPGGPPDGARGG